MTQYTGKVNSVETMGMKTTIPIRSEKVNCSLIFQP